MTLQNLLGISLDAVAPDRAHLARLFAAAQRNIADAQLKGLSAENRFDAAYKAIMQLAMAALHANGYRTLTSRPGHHQTAIQTLSLTVALAQPKVIVLDALRKQRNLADYSGELVSNAAAAEPRLPARDRANQRRSEAAARRRKARPIRWRQTRAIGVRGLSLKSLSEPAQKN